MNKLLSWLNSIIKAYGKQKGSTDAGCDSRNASELKSELPVSEAIRYRKRAKDAEWQLNEAAEALRKVSCLIHSTPTESERKRAYQISLNAWRAAKN